MYTLVIVYSLHLSLTQDSSGKCRFKLVFSTKIVMSSWSVTIAASGMGQAEASTVRKVTVGVEFGSRTVDVNG